MSEAQRYFRIHTNYPDGSTTNTDVFYKGSCEEKAVKRFIEDYPEEKGNTIIAANFDLRRATREEKRAFKAAKDAGCVYD